MLSTILHDKGQRIRSHGILITELLLRWAVGVIVSRAHAIEQHEAPIKELDRHRGVGGHLLKTKALSMPGLDSALR